MERIKSRGIIAIGIINFLFGVTLALWGLGVIIVMISSGTYFGIIASIPFLIISYGFIVVGRQVLELELKGRKANIFISIIGILFLLIFLLAMHNVTGGNLRDLIFNSGLYSLIVIVLFSYFIWAIIYLARPKVKEQFK